MTKNFTTPEILNKYRHTDKNVDNKIKQKEIIKEKCETPDKIINKNIDKIKATSNFTANYKFTNDDDNMPEKNGYNLDWDIYISDLYDQEYKFDNDENIIESFQKIYEKHDIKYEPRADIKFIRVRYLLKKI